MKGKSCALASTKMDVRLLNAKESRMSVSAALDGVRLKSADFQGTVTPYSPNVAHKIIL